MILLLGRSGSGKDTIRDHLVKLGFVKVLAYTSRTPKSYDSLKNECHFITKSQFEDMIKQNFFIAHTNYKDNYYGFSKNEMIKNGVLITDKMILRQLKSSEVNFVSFFIDVSENTRIDRMLRRGNDPNFINERIEYDRITFKGVKYKTDFIINNEGSIDETVHQIIEVLNKYKPKTNSRIDDFFSI